MVVNHLVENSFEPSFIRDSNCPKSGLKCIMSRLNALVVHWTTIALNVTGGAVLLIFLSNSRRTAVIMNY